MKQEEFMESIYGCLERIENKIRSEERRVGKEC